MILSVTGHRPDKLGGYAWSTLSRAVARRLAAELDRLRPERAITGMALGVDQWFAWLCVQRGIPFIAAVPFEGQDERWPKPEARDRYQHLLSLAAEVQIVTRLTPEDRKSKPRVSKAMHARNEWMIDSSDHLLAVWDGSYGGTGNCVQYAYRVGRPMTVINPGSLLHAA